MGIFDVFRKQETRLLKEELTKMIVGYAPSFSTYGGGVYEMDLTVAAIDSFARHVSKGNPKIKGNAYKTLEKQLQVYMNETMTTSQFLYRCATIYECEHNLFIVPIYDQYKSVCGFYPVSSIGSSIRQIDGVLMLEYQIENKRYAIPYDEVAHLRSHQYKKEFYGEGNTALSSTLQLIDTQNQGIINGVQQSATIRFLAKMTNIMKPEDIKKERQRLIDDNLTNANNGGVLLFDNRYSDIKQVESRPFIVDSEQAEYIKKNVFNYFGTNEKILQNNYTENDWASYYEGKIEPFFIQLSQGLTRVLFSDKELAFDNYILFESTRLQHADTKTKLELIVQLFDRGFITHNQGLEIMNLPKQENGDEYYIRREYVDIANLDKDLIPEKEEPDDNEGS